MNVNGLAESVPPETWRGIGFALDVLLKGLLILVLAGVTVVALPRSSEEGNTGAVLAETRALAGVAAKTEPTRPAWLALLLAIWAGGAAVVLTPLALETVMIWRMARRSTLEGRLLAVLDSRRDRRAVHRLAVLAGGLLLVAVLVPMAVLRPSAQAEDQENRVKTEVGAAKRQFGPIMERAVGFDTRSKTAYLDLDKGEFVDLALANTNQKPFVVFGRVTDEQGRPVEGVEVRANCGIGTLRRTGWTNTDAQGFYRLVFGPGMLVGRMLATNSPFGVGFQAATISVSKAACFEKNLGRQGNLAMTDQPGPGRDAQSFAGVVAAYEPYAVNFVMAPAALVKGELLDQDDRPVVGQDLYLEGDELPPSSNVLAATRTDAEGQFEFDGVPTNRSWWFRLPEGRVDKKVVTKPINFLQAGPYRLKLRCNASAGEGKDSLELVESVLTIPLGENPRSSVEESGQVGDLRAKEQWDEATAPRPTARHLPQAANTAEGLVQTNQPIVLDWAVCVPGTNATETAEAQRPRLCGSFIKFVQADGDLSATVHTLHESWPKCAWEVRLEILDANGNKVSSSEGRFESSGTIERYALTELAETKLHLGSVPAPRGLRFRCSLETLWTEQGGRFQFGEPVPLSLDLGTGEASRALSCRRLLLEKRGDTVTASVHIRLLPQPRSAWRFALTLFGADEVVVGQGVALIENDPQRNPDVAEADVFLQMTGSGEALLKAKGYRLRVERRAISAGGKAAELWEQIAQRKDKELRAKALTQLLDLLRGDQAQKTAALEVLRRVGDVPFDREPFRPLIRVVLKDADASARALAVGAIGAYGKPEDLPAVCELAQDDADTVREAVAFSVFGLDPKAKDERAGRLIERLLDDPVEKVRRATIRSLWGHPVTPAAEEKLIALSRGSQEGGGTLAYDAIYYALSTRPVVRLPVAQRLVELADDPHTDGRWRPLWGLSHHAAAPEARDLVVETLIRYIDDTLDSYVRGNCVWGLGLHGGAKAEQKLRDLVGKDEDPKIREEATKALERLSTEKAPPPVEDAKGSSTAPIRSLPAEGKPTAPVGSVLTVAKDGRGTHTMVQAAVDAAPSGATVRIGPGVYEENVLIEKPLTLEGAGWDKTAIAAKLAWGGSEEEFKRLAEERVRSAKSDEVWIYYRNDNVRVEGCRVSGAAWHGIRYGSSPQIVGNLIRLALAHLPRLRSNVGLSVCAGVFASGPAHSPRATTGWAVFGYLK